MLLKIKNKIGKLLIKNAFSIKFRKFGLKICGFSYGSYIYIGEDCIVISELNSNDEKIIIGNRVSIAPRVIFILNSNPNNSILNSIIKTKKGSIFIKEDAWIGAGAIIYPNITIGVGAIILTGSVVTKNVEPFTMVGGIPAKIIKSLDHESII